MSRLGGGIGTRGPGETKLEIDRRRIRKRIADLNADIKEVKKHRDLLRRSRREIPIPLVALVGYTNAGKSTILRELTGAGVWWRTSFLLPGSTTRRVVLPNNEAILLTDTVGFIQNLPHHLVAAFRATWKRSWRPICCCMLSTPPIQRRKPYRGCAKVLKSLGAADKPFVMVYNKFDLLPDGRLPYERPAGIALSARKVGVCRTAAGYRPGLHFQAAAQNIFISYDKAGCCRCCMKKERYCVRNTVKKGNA